MGVVIQRGQFRGRTLQTLPHRESRPLLSRIRAAIMDKLYHTLPGKSVLDFFAGTGSFGIETLSCGASHVTFVEQDWQCVQLLRENLSTLSVQNRTAVHAQDILHHYPRFDPLPPHSILFVGPPYPYFYNEKSPQLQTLLLFFLRQLVEKESLDWMILQCEAKRIPSWSFLRNENHVKIDQRLYGRTAILYLCKNAP